MDSESKRQKRVPAGRSQEKTVGRRCPHCGSSRVSKNGSYRTKTFGLVTRFICRTCGKTDDDREKRYDLREDARLFALVATGLPLSQIEGLARLKAETILVRLMRCYGNKETWDRIRKLLVSDHKIDRDEVAELSSLLGQIQSGAASFHALSRRQVAAKIRPRLKPEARTKKTTREQFFEQWRRSEEELLSQGQVGSGFKQSTEESVEGRWRYHLWRSRRPAGSDGLKKLWRGLKSRIEDILDCRVVVTSTGQFFRLEDDPRVARWMKQVREFDATRDPKLLDRLGPVNRSVFNQIRCPNREAHLHAKLEGAMGLRHGDRWQERMTVDCLAKGLGIDGAAFIEQAELVVELLRKTSRGD